MTRPLKIWLPAIRAGSGSDVFVERLAAALEARGASPVVTWFAHKFELFPDLLRWTAPPRGTDIVHANAAQAFAFKRPGIPLVATELHYVMDPAFRPYKSRAQHAYHKLLIGKYLDRSFAAADGITAISRFTADVLERVRGIQVTKVVPLWVDMDVFKPGRESGAPRRAGPFRLLFVGNESRRKGADVLLELAKRLGSDFEIRCTSGLRQGMQQHDASNIKVLGRLEQDDLVLEYQQCDAVLVPSRYEGFGYAALEAMACEKPVVGFACSAVLDVVGEEGASFLVAVDDLAALEARCRSLASDEEIRKQLGAMGRQRAASEFAKGAAVSAYIRLYENLVSRSFRDVTETAGHD